MVRYRHTLGEHKKVFEEKSAVPATEEARLAAKKARRYLRGNKAQRRKLVTEIKRQVRNSVERDADIFYANRKGSDKPRELKEHIVMVANNERPKDIPRLRGLDDFLEEHLEFEHIGSDNYGVVVRHPSKNRIAALGNVTVGKHPGYSTFTKASWPIASLFDMEAKPKRDRRQREFGPLFRQPIQKKATVPSEAKKLASQALKTRFERWNPEVRKVLRRKLRMRYGEKSDAYFLSKGLRFGEISEGLGDYGKHAQMFLILPESRGEHSKKMEQVPIGIVSWDPKKEGVEQTHVEVPGWVDEGVQMHLFPHRFPHLRV